MKRTATLSAVTFVVWAAVAASLVAWALLLLRPPGAVPPGAAVADFGHAAPADLARVLGAEPPPPAAAPTDEPPPVAADSRFALVGVVAPKPPGARGGVALIAVDGAPARAFRVGATVDGETVLQSVQLRSALLGPRDGPARVALELPPPAPAATGTLPTAGARPPPVRTAVPPPAYRGPGTVPGAPPPFAVPPPVVPQDAAEQPEPEETAPPPQQLPSTLM